MRKIYLLQFLIFLCASSTYAVENVYINEFLASNSITIADEFGEYDDWIEIYNANPFPVNLGGMYLTDDFALPTLYQIPTSNPALTTVPANGFLLFWADKDTLQGILHTNFKLSGLGEEIALVEQINGSLSVVDSLSYSGQTNDISYGRFPDGSDNFEQFYTLTPNSSNVTTTPPIVPLISGLHLNEIMASNLTTQTDNVGEYEDWIEIHNSHHVSIDVGGLYLTDDLTNLTLWRISTLYPDSTTIASNDYMLFWADRDLSQGIHHLKMGLSEKGEWLGLVQVSGTDTLIIDSLSFGRQGADIAYGALPDASENYVYFRNETPDATNETSESVVFFNAKLALQGAYRTDIGTMDTALAFKNLLPPVHPFNQTPWFYEGQERLRDTTDVLNTAVDWVLLEARPANNSYSIAEQRAAFVLQDGTLIDGTGIDKGVIFSNIDANADYYISVKSRNHIGLLSNEPMTLPNENPFLFTDFNNIWGGPSQVAQVGDGIYAMKVGDFDSNGVATVNDFNLYIEQSAAINAYTNGDANLDGHVTIEDFNYYLQNVSAAGISQIRY